MANLEKALFYYVSKMLNTIFEKVSDQDIEKLSSIMDFIVKNGLNISGRREIENRIYDYMYSQKFSVVIDTMRKEGRNKTISLLLDLFEKFNISTAYYRMLKEE